MRLRALPCLLLLLLVLPTVVVALDRNCVAPPSPEGTWVIQVSLFGGAFQIQYLQTFTQDGKTVAFLPTGREGDPNYGDSRIACPGEWRRAGHGSYDVTLYCLATQYVETWPDRLRFRLTLDKGARTFTELPFKYEAFLQDGTPAGYVEGFTSGRRLGIVPLD